MKVRLNLSTSPLLSNRRFTLGACLIGGVAFVGLIFLSQHTYSVWKSDRESRAQEAALENQIASLQVERRNLSSFFQDAETVKRRQRAAYLNSLIQQRAFPWIKIFMDLERILPEGARVVSIEPKLVGDNVQLRFLVGATTDESKLKFLKALETSAEFSHIELLSESRPNRPEQTDRVVLELQAQYSVI
jgi:Tfp pilus assembly protein PilN